MCFQNKHLGQAGSLCSAASMEYSMLELTLMLQRLNLKSNPSSKRSVSVRGESRKCLELAEVPTAGAEWSRGSHQQLQCNRTISEIVKSYIAGSPLPPKINMNQERTKASCFPPVLLSFFGHTSLAKHHLPATPASPCHCDRALLVLHKLRAEQTGCQQNFIPTPPSNRRG